MKGTHLTGWTFASLLAISVLICGPGGYFLFREARQDSTGMQLAANAQQPLLQVFIPTVLCFVLFGTLAVRVVERRSEGKLRAINAELEGKVRRRTAKLEEVTSLFRGLFEGAASAIFVCGLQGRILRANRQAEKLTNRSGEVLRQMSLHDLFQRKTEQTAQSFASSEKRPWEAELKIQAQPPRKVLIYENLILVRGKKFIQYIVQDMTEQKLCETQLSESRKMESIGRLAGGVAHDFNNLLTAIIGYAQLASIKAPLTGPVGEHIREIEKAGERAAKLIRQLLAFARQQPTSPKVLYLNDVILDLNKMLHRLIGEHIEVVTSLGKGLWPAEADPGQLEQIILNLSINARDAMPSGGTLRIETLNVTFDEKNAPPKSEMPPGDYVLLNVSDTGIGMSGDIAAKIFEPFFTTKGEGQGTGLGLSICYGVIAQNNGYIDVISAPGSGTTFRVYLPRTQKEAIPSAAKKRPEPLPTGSETVLLVEDDVSVRELASSVLRELGYRIFTAADGEEALQLVRGGIGDRIDLLLTDVVMPRLGGWELAKKLRSFYPNLKIIFASGYSEIVSTHPAMSQSSTDLLQKPFTPSTLAVRVRRMLDHPPPVLPSLRSTG